MSSITFWTRLEPYTRLDDIETGLQARMHDPLWLLARQWQTGEFQGEDAGTPVAVRARMERAPLARYAPRAATTAQPYRADIPLEAVVEREPEQIAADVRRDLRAAAEAGLMFLRMLERAGVSATTRSAFAHHADYALRPPVDPDPAGAHYLSVMGGRAPDGLRVYAAFVKAAGALPPNPTVGGADIAKVTSAGQAYRAWFEARFGVPAGGSGTPAAWVTERMEYAFAVSAATTDGEVVLSAAEYHGGTLDWYSFDRAGPGSLGVTPSDPQPEAVVRSAMPAPVRYPGMAADRWWQFEDGKVNLSRIEGDPDELMRLLLVEFSLVYANDWFVVPIDASPGALYRLRSLVVTDAFGERTLVPHYSEIEPDPGDWRMYSVSPDERALFVAPVLAGSLRGEPIEEVLFQRDELANLVWAVEHIAPSIAGGSVDRDAAHRRRTGEPPSVAGPARPDGEEALQYRIATTVPDNWIPFRPVRADPQRPDVRLRRAAALLDGSDTPGFSRPHGRILEPDRPDLSLYEEEVPGSGIRVVRHYQRARCVDGSTVLWLGREKGAGRGAASSGLAFDVLQEP